MNRRKWIIRSLGCLAAMAGDRVRASAVSILSDIPVRDAADAFDHILLGVSDLEAGIRRIEEQTGVRAELGGAHPGRGTRNALLSLGRLHYLEIIAPDPAQANHPDELGLAKLSSPRIVQWAIHTQDIAAVKQLAEAAGIKTIGPEPGSRERPDGKRLRWQTLGIEQTTPLVPFFIQWEGGFPHPSSDAPLLGTAKSLRFETPQPEELRRILHGVGINADIRKSDSPSIKLAVQTAKGAIDIS
jgi:Glyoxalase-like domain